MMNPTPPAPTPRPFILALVLGISVSCLAVLPGCDKESSEEAGASSGVGGVCGDLSARSCLDRTLSFYEDDKDAALVALEELCSGDHGTSTLEACTVAGHAYRTGTVEQQPDPDLALERYHKACPLDADNAVGPACFRIGIAHAMGKLTLTDEPTLPIDEARGQQYLSLACKQGMSEACQLTATP